MKPLVIRINGKRCVIAEGMLVIDGHIHRTKRTDPLRALSCLVAQ